MRRIGIGSNNGKPAITINPMPDATPVDFERQLRASGTLVSFLIGIEHHQGGTVTVTLTDFGRAKSALRAAGDLSRFAYLLPES